MRIIAWNCQMAFRRKFALVEALQSDILVISESESPQYLCQKQAELPWSNHLWIGDNPTKGLSVFAADGYSLKLKTNYNPGFRFIAPIEVLGPKGVFDLYAVWTQSDKTLSKGYVSHILNAMEYYAKDLNESSVVLGDFNSSPVFKQNGRKHSELVQNLNALGLESLYHRKRAEVHGGEKTPTFYLHRNQAKPYHLDYVFCGKSRKANLTVGAVTKWLPLSDHMPLIADF